jgi:hypothetical protein
VKRITDKQRSNGMCWCSSCKREGKEKVRAEYHDFNGNYCEYHAQKLERLENREPSLADEMTWMRL